MQSKPIGWNGKKLKEMLEESESLLHETKRYYGIEQLDLRERDPIRYEKIFSRLRGGLVNARETAMNISASPIVAEIGELCFVLYTPEGDAVTLSTGIMAHVHTMSDAIKFIVRNDYEENPGIKPGDLFCNNDTLIGDIHNTDVQTIVPIFWKDELVGWTAGVTHELDIGASTPGGEPLGPVCRYDGGLLITAEKIGEDDRLYRYYVERCRRATRTPWYWTLDEKTRIAGCHMVRAAVERLIEQEGVEVYKQFVREVIEEGRRTFLRRIKEMTVPGIYTTAAFIDVPLAEEKTLPPRAAKDWLMHCPIEISIGTDGEFGLSMEGASQWVWNQVNGSPTAMQGALWIQLTQTLIPNDKVNDGAYFATKQFFPKGSWANPDDQIAGTDHTWLPLMAAFTGVFRSLSRAYQARGYLEEIIAAYGTTYNEMQGGGKDAFGKSTAFSNFEFSCVGVGAGCLKDGLDYGAAMWNPEGDMGDIESWETLEPLLYLGRKIKPNTAGPGKFRGGSGFESLRMPWKSKELEVQVIGEGKVFTSSGLFGGYPNATGYRSIVHGSNMKELIDQKKPYPTGDGSPDESEMVRLVKGNIIRDKRATTLPEPYENYDLYLSYMRGGPGCGDVLERDPSRVERDLNDGHLTVRFAENVYGVVAKLTQNGEWAVDHQATATKREKIRQMRGRLGKPVEEWVSRERARVAEKRFSEPVMDMYRGSFHTSKNWARKFREFWKLPETFEF